MILYAYRLGYSGRHCDHDIDECSVHPCYFEGTCINLVNSFRCECKDGFLGDRCEAVLRLCRFINPCGQNAVCVERDVG